jgi:hypothetical protein
MLSSYDFCPFSNEDLMTNRISTLESAISLLEETKGNLSPVQLESLTIVARDFGIQLGHKQAGLGLEAWNGDRSRQMHTLTLEAFKETLTKLKPETTPEVTPEVVPETV